MAQVRAIEADGTILAAATVSFHDVGSERRHGQQQLHTTAAPSPLPTPPSSPPPALRQMELPVTAWPVHRLRDDGTLCWMGWPGGLPSTGALEQWQQSAALAFLSEGAAFEGLQPGVLTYPHRHAVRTKMVTALDYTIHYHADPQPELGWVLVQLESPWAADGRAIIRLSIWSPEGVLLATATQEMLLRTARKEPKSESRAGQSKL